MRGVPLALAAYATPDSLKRGSMMFSQCPGLASQPAAASAALCGPEAMFSPTSR